MGFLYEGITLSSFMAFVLLMGGLLFLNEITRRSKVIRSEERRVGK